jgi:hypothetical protein
MSETKVGLSPENFCRASREFERLGAKIGAAGKKNFFVWRGTQDTGNDAI